MENISRFIESLQHIFSLKKTKVTLYIAVVLWLSVATQMIVNRTFYEDFKIAEAFVKTNTADLQSDIEIIAEYQKDFLSETDKKDIIYHIADAIGLSIDREIIVLREGNRTEYTYSKQAKKAATMLKIVSLEQKEDTVIKTKHYIIVRLNILETIQSIDKYRDILENSLKELGVTEKQVTIQYEGSFQGALSKDEKRRMASLLVEELQGEIALEYEEGSSYTVYAYTGMINEYINSMGCKMNIQIALTYDEESDKTRIYLATPLINQSW